VSEDPDTAELREAQARRVREELERARSAADEEEESQHTRRADKAEYLRQKLEERAESEREARG
jgi:beta-lactamase class A